MTHPFRGLLAIELAGHIQRLTERIDYYGPRPLGRLTLALDEWAQRLIRYHDGEVYWYAEGLVHDYDQQLAELTD